MELLGEKAPKFSLKNQDGDVVDLDSLNGKVVVLYFYPKDMTSGCTKEACGFQDSLAKFNKLDAVVLGVSPDDEKSHQKFREKEGLKFDLLSDTEKETLETYGVWKEKSMYGRKYMGVERSTFVINKEGTIVQEWRKVRVPGHVDTVLEFVKAM